jgi:hypothetical protein
MLSPFLSRLALRLIGILLLGWGLLRCGVAVLLWRESQGGGQYAEVIQLVAIVLGGWGAYDAFVSVALLAAKNWARYLAFVTAALHFALGLLLREQRAYDVAYPMLAVSGVCAALLVLAGGAERDLTLPPQG